MRGYKNTCNLAKAVISAQDNITKYEKNETPMASHQDLWKVNWQYTSGLIQMLRAAESGTSFICIKDKVVDDNNLW